MTYLWGLSMTIILSTVISTKHQELVYLAHTIKNLKIQHSEIWNVSKFTWNKISELMILDTNGPEKSVMLSQIASMDKYTLVLVLSNFLLFMTTRIKVFPMKPTNTRNVTAEKWTIFQFLSLCCFTAIYWVLQNGNGCVIHLHCQQYSVTLNSSAKDLTWNLTILWISEHQF